VDAGDADAVEAPEEAAVGADSKAPATEEESAKNS
jgi:hypothetical protein